MKNKVLCVVLAVIFSLCGCDSEKVEQSNSTTSQNELNEQISDESLEKMGEEAEEQESVAIKEEETLTYELETLLPESSGDDLYYWVFLQNGREMINQKEVQEINDRLHELGSESSVGFHIITIEDYVTPKVLERVYEDLNGQMDFVTIGSGLCGFYMDEWQEHFVELSDELKNGDLQTFYTTVPENVWEANRIAGGIYSFSNSTRICVKGFAFEAAVVEEYGAEALLKLNEANGIEDEQIWKELYEIKNKPVCTWDRLNGQEYLCIAENPYARGTLSQFTDEYEELYFSFFTDDIRYNLETQKFEWLVESETYIEVKDKVKDLYEKGYLGAKYLVPDGMFSHPYVTGGYSNTATIQDMILSNGKEWDGIYVPAWKESRISRFESNRPYMYSFVYNKAKDGWGEVLDLLGSDEQIADILNDQGYLRVTISDVVYGYYGVGFVPDIDDPYELINMVYEEAQPDPIGGFIFNPVPIQEEWEEYNQKMSGFDKISLQEEATEVGEYMYPVFENIDMIWETYQERKEEAHIELVLEEVNRQYTEWKKTTESN